MASQLYAAEHELAEGVLVTDPKDLRTAASTQGSDSTVNDSLA